MRDGFEGLRGRLGAHGRDSRATRFACEGVLRKWGRAGGRDSQKALCLGSGTDGLWEESPR